MEFTVEVGGPATIEGIDALIDALGRAAVLTVSRFRDTQIEAITHAVW